MNAVDLPDRSPSSLKRTLPIDQVENDNASATPSPLDYTRVAAHLSRQASPALSSVTSLSSLSATPAPSVMGLDGNAQSSEPPTKKRKLTFQEKEQLRIEKEQKKLEREQKAAQKAQEKLLKDEERRQKAEEKEVKQREKDLEKQRKDGEKAKLEEERKLKTQEREAKQREKEVEKQRKEEERLKVEEEKARKARQQPKIKNFFAQPSTPGRVVNPNIDITTLSGSPCKSLLPRRSSLQGSESVPNEYRRTFLPFALPTNTKCAPSNQFSWDDSATRHMETMVDQCIYGNDAFDISSASLREFMRRPWNRRRPKTKKTTTSAKQIIRRIAETASEAEIQGPLTALREIPMRYLVFCEDIRPPYFGTYTKLNTKRLFRNPLAKLRPDTDYGYDSEAEWEEPEEGEDIDIDNESEGEVASEADEMEGFLDDEDDGQPDRRKVPIVDLEPVCSGLCFEDSDGRNRDVNGNKVAFGMYRMELLIDSNGQPIDPFSTSYWKQAEAPATSRLEPESTTSMHAPPKTSSQSTLNAIAGAAPPSTIPKVKASKTVKPGHAIRLLSGSELDRFKQAVNGSTRNKGLLLLLLKEQFPKATSAVLADTLNAVAIRGGSRGDKTWHLL